MVTNLAPVKGYISPARKSRLERIVEATSRRQTISKLIDELAEIALPVLEKKYGTFNEPTHQTPGKKKKAA